MKGARRKSKLNLILSEFLKVKGLRIGIAYKNLVTGEEFLHNPDHVFPGASVIKIAILIEFMRQVEREGLDPREKVKLANEKKVGGCGVLKDMEPGIMLPLKDLAVLMTVISDNTASNLLIDRLGMKKINKLLRRCGLIKSGIHRRFMVMPKTKVVKNFITAREIMVLLEKLYKNEILSSGYTDEALRILSNQQFYEKLRRFLPSELRVAHKPGEIKGVSHDAGIIFLSEKPYILCVFIEGLENNFTGDETIGRISRIIYDYTVEE